MKDSKSMWGNEQTQFFYQLDPIKILDAVDRIGFRTTGRCLQLNSLENRVYEVEIEIPESEKITPADAFRVVKFYRPGRWSEEQIKEEHGFLLELAEAEVPVITPVIREGETLFQFPLEEGNPLLYAVFPKRGGRLNSELNMAQLQRLGRSVALLHQIGRNRKVVHRLTMNPDTYGRQNLHYLLEHRLIPLNQEKAYAQVVEDICRHSWPLFQQCQMQRIHGDCHQGNILWRDDDLFIFDFDDMVEGPCVQDIWPATPGQDEESRRNREIYLEAYESILPFDRRSLKLIEPLRALRYIHFSAWIARRWDDQFFRRMFPQFGSEAYWAEQLADLQYQFELILRGQKFPE